MSDSELSRQYLRERNDGMHVKNLRSQMELAIRRDELIEKSVIIRQASFLLVALRQKLLAIPARVSRKCVGKEMTEIHTILTDAVIAALQEIRDLPKAGIDPAWQASAGEEMEEPRAKKRTSK